MEYSRYYFSLPVLDRMNYKEKLEKAGVNVDPYSVRKEQISSYVEKYPEITYPDICDYLVTSPNPQYSLQSMKAHKSLEAHKFFTSGWVKEVCVATSAQDQPVIIIGRVMHSQSIGATATRSWIIAAKDGGILTAHCDCKAGQGGTCSHVAAMLFHIETAVRIRGKETPTQSKAYWLIPKPLGKLQYEEVSYTDFTSATKKKRLLDDALDNVPLTHTSKPSNSHKSIQPTEEEKLKFLHTISEHGSKAVMLTVKKPFNAEFIPSPVSLAKDLPVPLIRLKDDTLVDKTFEEVKEVADSIQINITQEQATVLERATRAQSKSRLWFEHRAGRITSSNMKRVCSAKLDNPSLSLIKEICYPNVKKLNTAAIRWGLKHESTARTIYTKYQVARHGNFIFNTCGFHVSLDLPHIGASPDGMVQCDCCGAGCIEIKCPYKQLDGGIKAHPCLTKDTALGPHLQHNHPFFYQVQTHLFVTKTSYCDFVLWVPGELYIERITPDREIQNVIVRKGYSYFRSVILLELLCCYHSQGKCPERENKENDH